MTKKKKEKYKGMNEGVGFCEADHPISNPDITSLLEADIPTINKEV